MLSKGHSLFAAQLIGNGGGVGTCDGGWYSSGFDVVAGMKVGGGLVGGSTAVGVT